LPESARSRREFQEQLGSVAGALKEQMQSDGTERSRDEFLKAFQKAAGNDRANYIAAIQSLPAEVSTRGVRWLGGLVDDLCARAAKLLPSLHLFRNLK
jgi:hypothetical protein